MAKQQKLKPFGIADKLGYMFGDFGNDFTFILSTMILTKFYTDVMVVDAAVVGFIMMLSRFVDAVTDVTMGRICDAAKPTAAGKFKPWLLRMCIPVAFSSFVMYAPGFISASASEWSDGVKIAYLGISYILWGSFCYTGINIPYGSMVSAISSDPNDGAKLISEVKRAIQTIHKEYGMSVFINIDFSTVPVVRPERYDYIFSTCIYWIGEYHADGIMLVSDIDAQTKDVIRSYIDDIIDTRIVFGTEEEIMSSEAMTSIEGIASDTDTSDGAWYTLTGVKLQGEPTEKGIYVKDGKKVAIQ